MSTKVTRLKFSPIFGPHRNCRLTKGEISSDITKETKIKDVSGKELQALLVFSLSIKFMKDKMMQTSNKQLGANKLEEKDFHWVLTVPAIWNDKAKHFMRLAAEACGIPGERLSIALEPEAASLYCKHLKVDKQTLKENTLAAFHEGKTYMVLDAGGGTVDITIHEVCHGGGLKEVDKASGGAWGGITVDEAFIKFMEEVAGEAVIQRFKEDHMEDYLELLRDFESKKRNVDADTDNLVTLRVPMQLCELAAEMKSITLRNLISTSSYSQQVELKGDKLRIKSAIFRSFFDRSIQSIVQHVEELLKKPENSAVEAILMVGGYSESPLLQETVRKRFSKLTMITPGDAGLAVLKGAVIFGHEPIVIRERVAKYTYGIESGINVFGLFRIPGIFSILVSKGQKLVVGEPQKEETYVPSREDQTEALVKIYVTRAENPRSVNEPGC
ncbi:heat shock 70 kDa protein 12A-like isoform X4 [Dreissena polymorpha]|uniref:heat shock 70 kDa protein 12A-like isoform X4 n=1 Tax=Dreissena polymorpha TaxID=45954 RepID=UPI002265195C|nr:heat shock 70 kDa protein 12A-like isoform X4 [Dreissena polymorpha]